MSESVPDTLDLAAMAQLSINGLTRVTDPDPARDYSIYFHSDWSLRPPVLRHEADDSSDPTMFNGSVGKFVGPLQWNRIISGSTDDLDIQGHILDRYLKRVNQTLSFSGASARAYEGFIVNYLRDNNPIWKTMVLQAMQNWCEQLQSFVAPNGDEYGYWDEGNTTGGDMNAADPWRDEILLLAYKQLGYAPALATVAKHIMWARKYSGFFAPNGSFVDNHGDPGTGHFHIHALYLQPFLDYALMVKDTDLLNWVISTYAWAKSTSAHSVDLVGFFPEIVNRSPENPQNNSEGCSLADMVTLAIKLAKGGAGDTYWDDADRWVRNQWAEAQLTATYGSEMESWGNANLSYYTPNQPVETNDHTTDRSVGGFAGWPAIDDWRAPNQAGIQQCCTGNGARSIAFAWNNMLDYTAATRTLKVNLLLNRASAQADIYSYIPYSGRVDIKARQSISDLRVRVPTWGGSSVTVTVNGTTRKVSWSSRYMLVGSVASGDVVSVTFPITEKKTTQTVNGTSYAFIQRGSTVVDLSPAGTIAPLYQRSKYRNSTAPMLKVNRFVSSESDLWARTDGTWKLPITAIDGAGSPTTLLDGDQGSYWTSHGDGDSVIVDLGTAYTVNYVNLAFYQGESVTDKFDIQVSPDKRTWTPVRSGAQSCAITTMLQAFDVTDAVGRYVKLVSHLNSTGGKSTISEFEVWGSPASAATALHVSASAASHSDSGTAVSKTMDNDLSTRWSYSGVGEWVQYDFGVGLRPHLPRPVERHDRATRNLRRAERRGATDSHRGSGWE